jgi:hypothetical protein
MIPSRFLFMTRIRFVCLTLLLAVVLSQGEFTLNLGDDHLKNAILVRLNGTEDCQPVSSFFPEPIIATEDRSDTQQINKSQRNQEPVVVTIYNLKADRVCDNRRRHILTDSISSIQDLKHQEHLESTIPTFRIFSICIG